MSHFGGQFDVGDAGPDVSRSQYNATPPDMVDEFSAVFHWNKLDLSTYTTSSALQFFAMDMGVRMTDGRNHYLHGGLSYLHFGGARPVVFWSGYSADHETGLTDLPLGPADIPAATSIANYGAFEYPWRVGRDYHIRFFRVPGSNWSQQPPNTVAWEMGITDLVTGVYTRVCKIFTYDTIAGPALFKAGYWLEFAGNGYPDSNGNSRVTLKDFTWGPSERIWSMKTLHDGVDSLGAEIENSDARLHDVSGFVAEGQTTRTVPEGTYLTDLAKPLPAPQPLPEPTPELVDFILDEAGEQILDEAGQPLLTESGATVFTPAPRPADPLPLARLLAYVDNKFERELPILDGAVVLDASRPVRGSLSAQILNDGTLTPTVLGDLLYPRTAVLVAEVEGVEVGRFRVEDDGIDFGTGAIVDIAGEDFARSMAHNVLTRPYVTDGVAANTVIRQFVADRLPDLALQFNLAPLDATITATWGLESDEDPWSHLHRAITELGRGLWFDGPVVVQAPEVDPDEVPDLLTLTTAENVESGRRTLSAAMDYDQVVVFGTGPDGALVRVEVGDPVGTPKPFAMQAVSISSEAAAATAGQAKLLTLRGAGQATAGRAAVYPNLRPNDAVEVLDERSGTAIVGLLQRVVFPLGLGLMDWATREVRAA